jgi:type IX secretion system PorP/SprF family membrane protein
MILSKIKSFWVLVFLVCVNLNFAQDIHWSQFNENPLFLSPANTGNFKGDSRFSTSYRDQWRKVTVPFQTFALYFDSKFSKNEKFSYAFSIFNDVVGDGKFKTLEINLNTSYKKIISKDSSQVLISGIQFGLNHRQFNFPNFNFDEQYNGISYDPNLPITEDLISDKKNNFTLGSGLIYQIQRAKNQSIQFGISAFNLNQANQSFYGEKVKRDVRLILFSRAEIALSEKSYLIPSFMYQKQGTFQELLVGSQYKHILKDERKSKKSIYFGLFIRRKDAFFLNFGLNLNTWQFGLSYDINTSSLKPASASRGGIELNLTYIIHKFKANKIQHRICPEFI